MSKKSKTIEMNDIIESSYTEPDYSYDNNFNDHIDNRQHRNTNHSSGGNSICNPFSKTSTMHPNPPVPALASTPPSQINTSNIFMKYTGGVKTNIENGEKSVAITTIPEIKNTEDEFPSLGGSKKLIVLPHVPMNFKKIVETKKPVELQPQVVQAKPNTKSNSDDYYNRFNVYEQVKYYSEKTARSKIYSNRYSDDEDVEDVDVDVDVDDIDNYDE